MIQRIVRLGFAEIDRGRQHLIPERLNGEDGLYGPSCAEQVAYSGLSGARGGAFSPNRRTMASTSMISPTGVPVACALM